MPVTSWGLKSAWKNLGVEECLEESGGFRVPGRSWVLRSAWKKLGVEESIEVCLRRECSNNNGYF